MNTTKINNYTYALSVDLLWPTLYSDADIKCQTNQSEDGTCATIGCMYTVWLTELVSSQKKMILTKKTLYVLTVFRPTFREKPYV